MDIFSYFTSEKLSFDDDEFKDAGAGTALSLIADAFEEILDSVNKDVSVELHLKPFCDACSLISVLFGSLGIAFKFAEMEYSSKIVRSENRFEKLERLKEAASTAYKQVCAPYHTWAVRTAVSAGMCALHTRDQLLLSLNETDESAEKEMRRYIKASLPVIEYIDNLYTSRGISLDR
ncbi:putative glycolipid transfer protein [Helianthus anomalus]